MKKSIKYAGIAAATLLAVAPVAAPVVSSTTNVQAATVDDADATQAQNEINDFKGQFTNVDYVETATKGNTTAQAIEAMATYFGEDHAGNISDVQNAAVTAGSNFMNSPKSDVTYPQLTDLNTKVYFTATDASSKTYNGQSVGQKPSDVIAALKSDSRMPMTINVHFKSADLDSVLGSYKDFSFNINKTDDNELKTVSATFSNPISVAKNSKVNDTQLVNTNDVVLKDQDGNSLSVANIQFGAQYFSSYTDAINAAKADGFDPTKVTASDAKLDADNQLNGDIKGGEFKTAGTYYQTVTYTANKSSALDSFLSAYTDQNTVDPDYTVIVNGKNAVSGVDFANQPAATEGENAKGATITFVRSIKVSDNEAQWTVTDNKGVVTTKSDTPYYTLVNDNGDKIANRALAKNSAWITDQKRVDQNGNTQYRVATGEWIDANNVTFSDKATTDEGAYTDEQALNGKVTLDGPSSFVYFLYNDNGEQISSRALSGDSAWFTDKKATNAAGVTVYHVATGEWVQAGNGVNYSAY